MAIDITGINNENEFYTHHYLAAILESDLKDVFSEWKRKEDDEAIKPPHKLLGGLRKNFFSALSLLEKERDVGERISIQRGFTRELLEVLGYQSHCRTAELDDAGSVPLLGGISKADGSPDLWIIEAVTGHGEEADPLELMLCEEQYSANDEDAAKFLEVSFEEIITRHIFSMTEPPRWVILVSFSQLLLVDRTKWHEKRLLRFDLREILDRRETSTLQATTALLHRDSICPKDGMPLLDTLDENSHKHAFAVSEDLKYSLRRAIELLGNEAVYYLREKLHEKIYGRDMAQQLTRECLRYMYRLLFLFYIEARPELGYLPDKSEEYRKGYSLEALRDLEMVQLNTEEAMGRFFLHESIQTLFRLLYEGFRPKQRDMFGSHEHHTFHISPLRSHLFNPEQTPILNRVKLRNFVMQEIIELMSLSRAKKGKNTRRGRISYAQLGINQLGAVYEALLSYQGFFAETELYEVKKAGEQYNELETAYFVKPEDIEQYTKDEKVYHQDGSLVKFEKGTFIYRLAGRDREKSASYYTPEVLTKCLVKYALKELLKGKTADEILELTVCEPAMGSAAFLNEAVNQLAKAYLDLKQKEIEQVITHDEYPKELQKVKMYIADNNVYGVDLNPVAVELAEISLWLNTIYEGAFVPWFGMQLVCGNSLIGARRQVFSTKFLKKEKKSDSLWLDEVPVRVMPGEERKADTVYHFLLPDKGMADYKDKVIKEMAGEEIKAINEWRKDFIQPFSKSEIEQLKKLSTAVDKLWKKHTEMQRQIDDRTTDPLQVFGQEKPEEKFRLSTTEDKDRIFQQEIFSKNVGSSSPYRRLKLVMDYWCALWFWPIEKAEMLPSRAEYLFDLTLLLEGNLYDSGADEKGPQLLFPDTRPKQQSLTMIDEFGYVNVDKLCEQNPRLGLVRNIADRYRYIHWELEFANLFESRGGFDLILGNPPWLKVEWNEGGIMGDVEPLFVLRKFSASKLAEMRQITVGKYNLREVYLATFEESNATQNFLNGLQNYPLLKGMQSNLYKCFLPQSWTYKKNDGVSAFLHPEGIYDDPNGGIFRENVYSRLSYHFQFVNVKKLFSEILHWVTYSINIYRKSNDSPDFITLANLFLPRTIDDSLQHPGLGTVGGIKDGNDKWNITGHLARIISVREEELALFARLYDETGTPPLQAKLPALHSRQLVGVLRKFAAQPKRLGDIQEEYYTTVMWDETNAVKKDHTIRRETRFPESPREWILSGPHFFVGNPLYKTPNRICRKHHEYASLDLTSLPDDYLPRTNYVPDCDEGEYRRRTPFLKSTENRRQGTKVPVTNFYRLVYRGMLSQSGERTLTGAIIPPEVAHINGAQTTAFSNLQNLLSAASIGFSLVGDFYIKSTGRSNLHFIWENLPLLDLSQDMAIRILTLSCLTNHYAGLWQECWDENFLNTRWAKINSRLPNTFFANQTPVWQRNYALRSDYIRRQALVEIDVLVAQALDITLDELKTIYQIQFPVLRQNENDTWYDQNGRIVFTCSKGLPGVGFSRPEWNEIKEMHSGTVSRTIIDDTQLGGPVERIITYEAPFDRCDREKDYEVVWSEFERRFKESGDKGQV
ncbi:MAG: hypothetical protein KKG35_03015 [Proteobacteria bacterium]|nr:hypothetical protein [Pseudomonadota bacterium]